jgi:hypothetical protein
MIHLLDPHTKIKEYINTTSRSTNWSRGLSPFLLGPVELYNGMISLNVENAWQFSKVYKEYTNNNEDPTPEYFNWANKGWNSKFAYRYPLGKGRKPLYSWWNGEKLDYITARKKIYYPLYSKTVEKTESYKILEKMYKETGELWLWDFDCYDHRKLNMNYDDVLNCPNRKMGHAFVLAMMLEGHK